MMYLIYIGIGILMALIASGLIHRGATKTHKPSRPWSSGSLIGSLLILAGCTLGLYYFVEYQVNLFSDEPKPVSTALFIYALILPLIAPWLFYLAYRTKQPVRSLKIILISLVAICVFFIIWSCSYSWYSEKVIRQNFEVVRQRAEEIVQESIARKNDAPLVANRIVDLILTDKQVAALSYPFNQKRKVVQKQASEYEGIIEVLILQDGAENPVRIYIGMNYGEKYHMSAEFALPRGSILGDIDVH